MASLCRDLQGRTASLTVTGESASVVVNAVGPSGQPVVAQVRLFRMVSGRGYEVAYSNTGSLAGEGSPRHIQRRSLQPEHRRPAVRSSTFDVAAGEVTRRSR